MPYKLKVLFISPELAPFAKVGGLADVANALPKQLKKQGVDVRIIIPRYNQIKLGMLRAKVVAENKVEFKKKKYLVKIFSAFLPGSKVPVYLIEQPDFFLKPLPIYGNAQKTKLAWRQMIDRFSFLSYVALESMQHTGFYPDIIHCHDWPTAFAPVLLKTSPFEKYRQYKKIKSVITIHSAAQQVSIKKTTLNALNIASKKTEENILALGISAATAVNTVSPTYAKEILQSQFSGKLAPVFRQKKQISGIVNGIDIDSFNPQTDKYIWKKYNIKTLTQKKKNKAGLQDTLNLQRNENLLVIGMVSRLFKQKGIELLIESIKKLIDEPFQFVILGQGDERYHYELQALEERYPQKLSFNPEFDRHLARQIYAGSDVFVMPSLFEPCGLGQLIAMRYGTVPVVRDTGGLHDTIVNQGKNGANGFVFKKFEGPALTASLQAALRSYQNPKQWKKLQIRGMKQDFSWKKSAEDYIKLYKSINK